MTEDVTSRRSLLQASAAALAVSVAGCLGAGTDEWTLDETLTVTDATQYQGPQCACCDVFAEYLEDHLNRELQVSVTEELSAVKNEFGVPRDLWSCHTVQLDEYIIEGHIPVKEIQGLLADEPDIEGIALPGMPSGSPGMGGEKSKTWTIYSIQSNGTVDLYSEI